MDVQQSSPFDLLPDLEGQKNALTTALRIVQDFALYIVVSEPSRVRPRLMNEMEARLADKTIQNIPVSKGTQNLLHLIADSLTDPLPDVVFVYGLENSISASAEPRSHPLLLNLNATRNNFYALLPRPLVLWVPAFVLKAIVEAAPDFISVRSSVYTFPLDSNERQEMAESVLSIRQAEMTGLEHKKRNDYIREMQSLLAEYRSLPIQERNVQDESQILNHLAIAYHSSGDYAEAEPLFIEALAARRQSLPEGHPDIATGINNLATIFQEQGRYTEAEPLFYEALAIRRQNLSEWHPDIATSLNNLATLYDMQGRYAEAEGLFKEAFAIDQKVLPANHLNIAIDLNNLAAVYMSQGRNAEAEPILNRALVIRQQGLPEGHPDIASNLNNLGEIYRLQGRYAEAEPLLCEALAMRQQGLPEGHPDRATSLNNLALLYKAQSRYAEAEPLFNEALVLKRQGLPNGHPNIAISLNNLAGLYQAQGRYTEAEPLFNEALTILRPNLGESHPFVKTIVRNLAILNAKRRADDVAAAQRFKLPTSLAKRGQHRKRPK